MTGHQAASTREWVVVLEPLSTLGGVLVVSVIGVPSVEVQRQERTSLAMASEASASLRRVSSGPFGVGEAVLQVLVEE
jgi:hypothetical protein